MAANVYGLPACAASRKSQQAQHMELDSPSTHLPDRRKSDTFDRQGLAVTAHTRAISESWKAADAYKAKQSQIYRSRTMSSSMKQPVLHDQHPSPDLKAPKRFGYMQKQRDPTVLSHQHSGGDELPAAGYPFVYTHAVSTTNGYVGTPTTRGFSHEDILYAKGQDAHNVRSHSRGSSTMESHSTSEATFPPSPTASGDLYAHSFGTNGQSGAQAENQAPYPQAIIMSDGSVQHLSHPLTFLSSVPPKTSAESTQPAQPNNASPSPPFNAYGRRARKPIALSLDSFLRRIHPSPYAPRPNINSVPGRPYQDSMAPQHHIAMAPAHHQSIRSQGNQYPNRRPHPAHRPLPDLGFQLGYGGRFCSRCQSKHRDTSVMPDPPCPFHRPQSEMPHMPMMMKMDDIDGARGFPGRH